MYKCRWTKCIWCSACVLSWVSWLTFIRTFRELFNSSTRSRLPSSSFLSRSFNGIQQQRQFWSSRSLRHAMVEPNAEFTEHAWWKESVECQVGTPMPLALGLHASLLKQPRSIPLLSETRTAMATAMCVE